MKWLVLLHVLGATIWVGGHLVLAITIVPTALRERKPEKIIEFEKSYERIGLPALLVQVVTGLWMATIYLPPSQWLSMSSAHHGYLWIKIVLLISTLAFAVHARFFILPRLSVQTLPALAYHIWTTTLLALGFVITGLSFRFGYW